MADAVKCDKCGVYFDKRPSTIIDLPGGFALCFHIIKAIPKEILETNPIAEFITRAHPDHPIFTAQDTCPKCQQEMLVAALTTFTVQKQIEDIGGER